VILHLLLHISGTTFTNITGTENYFSANWQKLYPGPKGEGHEE
jgi:hypothetical protein